MEQIPHLLEVETPKPDQSKAISTQEAKEQKVQDAKKAREKSLENPRREQFRVSIVSGWIFKPRNNTGRYSFFVLLASLVLVNGILLLNPNFYNSITLEDGLIEYLGFAFLLLTAIFLLVSGTKSVSKPESLVLCAMGLLFFFMAGEEISWGQRWFQIETPTLLLEINHQKELNLHNINKQYFIWLVEAGTLIFTVAGAAFCIAGITRLWHIPLPNEWIISCFALSAFYYQYPQGEFHFRLLHFNAIPVVALLTYSIVKKQRTMFGVSLSNLLVLALLVFLHLSYHENFPANGNGAYEISETLFALSCMAYALYIQSRIPENNLEKDQAKFKAHTSS
ncbi:MAG: hypothetical protein ACEPOZ_04850 [Marinifilaceae bacterium]